MESNWEQLVEQLKELKFPKRPVGPKLNLAHPTADDARQYALRLEAFTIAVEEYKKEKYEYDVRRAELGNRIAEAMLDSVSIPTQYRSKCWALAWEYGHSSGYHEIHNYLLDLETIFV